MKRTEISRIVLVLSLCVLTCLVSCKKPGKAEPEKKQPEEPKKELTLEELFLFEYAKDGRRYLFNKSSELEDPGVYEFGKYGPHNLFDGEPATCWAEGVSGDGVGEFVYFEIKKGIEHIRIVNGYGKSRDIFNKNNRVKKMKAKVYVGINRLGDATELGLYFQSAKLEEESELSLDDTMEEQSLAFPFDWSKIRVLRTRTLEAYMLRYGKQKGAPTIKKEELEIIYILWLEIRDIYKGTKYEDCCISEITCD